MRSTRSLIIIHFVSLFLRYLNEFKLNRNFFFPGERGAGGENDLDLRRPLT